MTSVAVVIPTKNESRSIATVIGSVRDALQLYGATFIDVIVVDDSHDDTRKIVRSMGARIVVGEGKGLGFAMMKGLKEALVNQPDVILAIDGDGQADCDELGTFITPIIADEADLVLGSRFREKGLIEYKYRLKNRVGTIILSKILRSMTNYDLTDSHGGIRAYSPALVRELQISGNFTYVQETILDAYEKGFRAKEIPSKWLERKSGKSRVVRSIVLYIFNVLPFLVLRAGLHIKGLYTLGLMLIFAAFCQAAFVAVDTRMDFKAMLDRHSIHLFLLLGLSGINFFFFCLIIDLLLKIDRKLSGRLQ